MKNTPPSNPLGKGLMAIILCLLALVILKPERLTNTLQEISEREEIAQLTQQWETTLAPLVQFSQWQQDIVNACTTTTILAKTIELDELDGQTSDIFATNSLTEQGTNTITPVANATVAISNATLMHMAQYNATLTQMMQHNGTLATGQHNGTQAASAQPPAPGIDMQFPLYQPLPEYYIFVSRQKDALRWRSIPSMGKAVEPQHYALPRSSLLATPYFATEHSLLQNALLHNYIPLPKPKIIRPLVLLTGDSMMMEGLGPSLLRTLRQRQDVEVRREAVYSTGLCRRDYFDWPAHMEKLVAEHNPKVVVISIGGNDAQDIVDANKKRHIVGTPSWQEQYGIRAEELAQKAQAKGAALVWVGMPILGKEPQAKNTILLTAQQKAVTEKGTNRFFVDIYATLTDSKGAYTTFMKDKAGAQVRVRSKDQVHVSEAGGKLLAPKVLPVIDLALATPKVLPTPETTKAAETKPVATPKTEQAATVKAGKTAAQVDAQSSEYLWHLVLISSVLDNAPTYLVFANTAGENAPEWVTALQHKTNATTPKTMNKAIKSTPKKHKSSTK